MYKFQLILSVAVPSLILEFNSGDYPAGKFGKKHHLYHS